jgi:hypothetical protein
MAIKPDRHRILVNEQPIRWGRAFGVGVLGALAMMAVLDICFMAGLSPFTFESYLGSLLWPGPYGPRNWIAGFIANLALGGLFGLLYGYFFEYVFRRADARAGVLAGLVHAVLAAVVFFPYFSVAHGDIGTGLYENFGFFGAGLSAGLPVLLLAGHLLFGATMGALYGPVRSARLRERYFEPEEGVESHVKRAA